MDSHAIESQTFSRRGLFSPSNYSFNLRRSKPVETSVERTDEDIFVEEIEISTPYDPVHLTHIGFDAQHGEFTGLPNEWQRLLREGELGPTEADASEPNPDAVTDMARFFEEAGGEGSRRASAMSDILELEPDSTVESEQPQAPAVPESPTSRVLPRVIAADLATFMAPRVIEHTDDGPPRTSRKEVRDMRKNISRFVTHLTPSSRPPLPWKRKECAISNDSDQIQTTTSEKDHTYEHTVAGAGDGQNMYHRPSERDSLVTPVLARGSRFVRAKVAYGRHRTVIAVVPQESTSHGRSWLCCM
ncbi:PBD-domain-containing protein [Obba rivulosa]|uniref:non-specific serine/threonine protein kinase n=1 Tax=Obba rivulosa TaxID=1052685 RepID=A0A8E2J2G8_9APHY|nr:PBD-domain-containing protein [Obba rivulosa]